MGWASSARARERGSAGARERGRRRVRANGMRGGAVRLRTGRQWTRTLARACEAALGCQGGWRPHRTCPQDASVLPRLANDDDGGARERIAWQHSTTREHTACGGGGLGSRQRLGHAAPQAAAPKMGCAPCPQKLTCPPCRARSTARAAPTAQCRAPQPAAVQAGAQGMVCGATSAAVGSRIRHRLSSAAHASSMGVESRRRLLTMRHIGGLGHGPRTHGAS